MSLVAERDGKGLGDGTVAKVKKLFKIDLNVAAALEISGLQGDLAAYAAPKTEFLDVRKSLVDAVVGITDRLVPSKIEADCRWWRCRCPPAPRSSRRRRSR